MPSIACLVKLLIKDFPEFKFYNDDTFCWSPESKTIYYPVDSTDSASLLHELAHGVLGHDKYKKDIQLIEIERDAWEYASNVLSKKYGIIIKNSSINKSLDSYREWLNARSSCPICKATGFEYKKNNYKCIACNCKWRVNEARICGLKRYKI